MRMFASKGWVLALMVVGGLALVAGAALAAGWSGNPSGKPALPPVGTPVAVEFRVYLPLTSNTVPPSGSVSGVVVAASGPVPEAVVRVKATANKTTTALDGSFTLGSLQLNTPISVTAWADGYFVGWANALPDTAPLTITLSRYYTTDNPDYDWFSTEGAEGSLSCSHCMPCYTEWQQDAHSQTAVNPRFLTMYNGTDLEGNQSPLTEYFCDRDYGCVPLPPDPGEPYYGPGYKLDFPDSAGNCATCHVPVAAAYPGGAYQADINEISGIETEGVFCEFCHKIGAVTLEARTGLPYPNLPGVMAMQLFRPEEDQQLFFGNFDDVTRRVSYLPLIEESAYCAPCHYGVFWDVTVYNSFGEWLMSPYSDPLNGKTCQNCHMPVVDYNYFVYPEMGGLLRDRNRIFSHRMPGASDEKLLQNAVSMTVTASLEGNEILVQVTIANDQTGHHVPTDSPLRQLILLVETSDEQGASLIQQSGPTVPEWGGVGDPAGGYYAGLPGKAYAKVLQELWTNVMPTGAYWNQTRLVSDNRLAAFESDTSSYSFIAPDSGDIKLTVTLLFRRAFIELADQKGWQLPDILMEQETIMLNPTN